jgi:poly-beta-1,6-N-acetyl-D-glucosamine synthase
MPATLPRYVLITPARNEAASIELTIRSVIAQTVLPVKWVIVSDGSTDGTDEIVQKYLAQHDWIELLRLPERAQRNFAGKAGAFNAGCARAAGVQYEVIGNLDADITFDSDYFAFLLARFAENPRLGVAGTPFVEGGRHYDYRFTNIEHVSGACQLFRRACFDAVGGYLPIKGGGIDWTAVTTARMKGWQTRTFTEKTCVHHRTMGTASTGRLKGFFRHGQKDCRLGGHPVWQIVRAGYQMTRRPYVIGGLLLLTGYFSVFLRGAERPIPEELVRFHQAEQLARLKSLFRFSRHMEGARS